MRVRRPARGLTSRGPPSRTLPGTSENQYFSSPDLEKSIFSLSRSLKINILALQTSKNQYFSSPGARARGHRPASKLVPGENFQNTSFKKCFSEEIYINNHRPKSFLSLMEHPNKDSAWFTRTKNNQCEAALHTLLLNYLIIFLKARWRGSQLRCAVGYIYIYIYYIAQDTQSAIRIIHNSHKHNITYNI